MEYMKKSVLNLQSAEIDLNCCIAFHTFDIIQSSNNTSEVNYTYRL